MDGFVERLNRTLLDEWVGSWGVRPGTWNRGKFSMDLGRFLEFHDLEPTSTDSA